MPASNELVLYLADVLTGKIGVADMQRLAVYNEKVRAGRDNLFYMIGHPRTEDDSIGHIGLVTSDHYSNIYPDDTNNKCINIDLQRYLLDKVQTIRLVACEEDLLKNVNSTLEEQNAKIHQGQLEFSLGTLTLVVAKLEATFTHLGPNHYEDVVNFFAKCKSMPALDLLRYVRKNLNISAGSWIPFAKSAQDGYKMDNKITAKYEFSDPQKYLCCTAAAYFALLPHLTKCHFRAQQTKMKIGKLSGKYRIRDCVNIFLELDRAVYDRFMHAVKTCPAVESRESLSMDVKNAITSLQHSFLQAFNRPARAGKMALASLAGIGGFLGGAIAGIGAGVASAALGIATMEVAPPVATVAGVGMLSVSIATPIVGGRMAGCLVSDIGWASWNDETPNRIHLCAANPQTAVDRFMDAYHKLEEGLQSFNDIYTRYFHVKNGASSDLGPQVSRWVLASVLDMSRCSYLPENFIQLNEFDKEGCLTVIYATRESVNHPWRFSSSLFETMTAEQWELFIGRVETNFKGSLKGMIRNSNVQGAQERLFETMRSVFWKSLDDLLSPRNPHIRTYFRKYFEKRPSNSRLRVELRNVDNWNIAWNNLLQETTSPFMKCA